MNMTLRSLAASLAALFFTACQAPLGQPSPSTASTGSLAISVASADSESAAQSRTLSPTAVAIASYQATATKSGSTDATASATSGSLSLSDLAPGDWTVTVDGLDASSVVVASASATVTIESGKQASLSLTLQPAGKGSLSLAITWPPCTLVDEVSASLSPKGGGTAIIIAPTLGFYSASASTPNLAAGSYTLILHARLQGRDVVAPRVETVNIAASQTTTGSYTFLTNDLSTSVRANPNPVVRTFAGYGWCQDGIGTEASFYNPYGIASDGSNLFVADTNNHTIRKMVIATGAVSTLAGSPGLSGTADGAASTARFNLPQGIACDGSNLYVADTGNNTIRKIVIATGTVSTLAGSAGQSGTADGAASTARFNYPKGIACDGSHLYVADANNHTIRKIVIASGLVSTLAGSAGQAGSADGAASTARFYYPQGIACDGSHLYVADTDNYTIRKIVIATGTVSTLAGSPGQSGTANGAGSTARFNYPQGIARDGSNLYVADFLSNTIRKIVIATGTVSTLAGSPWQIGSADGATSTARFNYPQGIACDGSHLYVADTDNHSIRKIVIATGLVSTLAGSPGQIGTADGAAGAARFYNPVGIACDGSNLFVADTSNRTIRKIVIATGVVSTLAGSPGLSGSADGAASTARFTSPTSIACDSSNLYVAETSNHTIRKIVIATGTVSTLAGSPGQAGSADGVASTARFTSPASIASDGSNLYVADSGNQTIRKIVIATGTVSTLAGSPGQAGSTDGVGNAARFNLPQGIACDGSNLYVTEINNHTIRKIVIATGAVSILAGSPGQSGSADGAASTARFYNPYGIACDGSHLFVANFNNTIRKIVIATGLVSTLAGSPGQGGYTGGTGGNAKFTHPAGMAIIGNKLFVADRDNHSIRMLTF